VDARRRRFLAHGANPQANVFTPVGTPEVREQAHSAVLAGSRIPARNAKMLLYFRATLKLPDHTPVERHNEEVLAVIAGRSGTKMRAVYFPEVAFSSFAASPCLIAS
jgi:hypothetical protein